VLLGSAVLTLSGCGALFNGTHETVTATSAPDAASIDVEPGGEKYTTPASMSLERKNEYNFTFTKAGYTNGTFHIGKSMSGGILVLDILFTGLIGVVVDAATGAWYHLDPTTAVVALTKTSASVPGPETIHVGVSRHGKAWSVESSEPGVTVEVRKK
jgi:hypothetical protein